MFYLTFDLHFQFSINHNYILYANFDKIANSVVNRAVVNWVSWNQNQTQLDYSALESKTVVKPKPRPK